MHWLGLLNWSTVVVVLEAPQFYVPGTALGCLKHLLFFPFITLSIILWVTTHLLCVYRNKWHLSKMNSEDSAEVLLLSGWKLTTNFRLHTSPTGITWVLGKCCHFLCKRHRSCFSVTEAKPTTFSFLFKIFSKHLFLNKCFSCTP